MSLIGLGPSEPYADRTDLDSLAGQASPMARLLLGDVRERFGMLDRPVRDYLDYLREFDLWGLEDKITCPILNIAGEGEGSLYWVIRADRCLSEDRRRHDRVFAS